jgi:DNA repair ATPase RecN
MDNIEAIIEALHTLSARLETLRTMERSELRLPGRAEQYRSTLEDAYAAYCKIETAVDELGQELEYHHQRLGAAGEPNEQE